MIVYFFTLINCWFCLLFFFSSNWCLASHGKSYRGPKRYLDFLIFTLEVFIKQPCLSLTSNSMIGYFFTLMNCWFCLLFFVFKLMFGNPWKKLSRPKKVFRFSDFHSNSVHLNNHVLLWIQIQWLVTFHFDELLILFTFSFSVFKLMFGKPWKKLTRPKKVFRFFDFHFNSVHINNNVHL
jgi:hypothetical protein